MPTKIDRQFFTHKIIFADYFLDDGNLASQWLDLETREVFDLEAAFDECVKKSKLPARETTCQFFYIFILLALESLEWAFYTIFLYFPHDDDDGPTYDEKYLDNIRNIQRDLIEQIRRSIQRQFGETVNSQVVELLLEESEVRSVLHRRSPESILADSHDEQELRSRRNFLRSHGFSRNSFENFEPILAKYQIRQKGLKVRDNSELISRLSDEIRARDPDLVKPDGASSQDSSDSEQSETQLSDSEGKSRTITQKKRGNGTTTGQIWKHLTISRDETSASDFLHERIVLLFFKTQYLGQGTPDTRVDSQEDTEGAEISQIGQKSQSYTRTDTAAGQSHSHHSLHSQASFGLKIDHCLGSSLRVKDMEVLKQSSTGGNEESGRSSGASTPNIDNLQYRQLVSRIKSLELENQLLKDPQTTGGNWKIIHFITNPFHGGQSGYFDKPVLAPGFKHDDFTLKAFLPVNDVGDYIKQTGLDFVVSRFYSAASLMGEVRRTLAKKQQPPDPLHYREHIQLQSQEMAEALQEFLSLQPAFWDIFPSFDPRAPIEAPYIFWYTYRSTNALDQLKHPHQDLMRTLTSWIEENYAEKYTEAIHQLAKGTVTLRTMPFLVCPGDVVIWKEKAKIKAAITSSLLVQRSPPILYWDKSQMTSSDNSQDSKGIKQGEFLAKWTVETWNYKFNGEFIRDRRSTEIKFKASSLEQEVEISKLGVYPLRFADEETKLQLETRGRTFWRCRNRNFVSYTGEEGMFASGERFMVDFQIYKQLHSDSFKFQPMYEDEDVESQDRHKISAEDMESETPPSHPDIYVFPNTVPGYNMRSKKWVDLEVDFITDVKWNTKSFESLVIDAKAKEMIQALVSHQIESEQGTDLIHRKGNGLIILLHGGPGTGKTFTAETVAELANKPLFCVTCGDIGTVPEQVEKYLESVLYLGKTWGCVVLIDEAEVFLEQRSLDNLERNALVSVFLRVLEYYEGILILTTNRVGTFDEAFKSRILLSLHYDKLSIGQRRKIWRGFIKHLEDTHASISNKGKGVELNGGTSASTSDLSQLNPQHDVPDIDYQEILDSLDELAGHELNGRQIRNIITTARQLAKFRRKTLNYGLLQEVILISGKFDEYFSRINENQTDEQIARSDGLR